MPSELPKLFIKRHAPRNDPKAPRFGEDPKSFLRRMSAALRQQAMAQQQQQQAPTAAHEQ